MYYWCQIWYILIYRLQSILSGFEKCPLKSTFKTNKLPLPKKRGCLIGHDRNLVTKYSMGIGFLIACDDVIIDIILVRFLN